MTVFIPSAADFFPPPYSFETATAITFIVEPNTPQKLHDICAQFLNTPLAKPNRFILNLERVLLTFSRFPEVESMPNPALGFLSYQEVSLIIMVKDTKTQEVGMFAPILFLDGPEAGNAEYFASSPIALGREVFGLPKIRGEIKFNTDFFTGEVKSPYPSALNTPLQLPLIVKVSLPGQAQEAQLLQGIVDLDEKLLAKPNDVALLKKKQKLMGKLETVRSEVRTVRRAPMVGPPYHPFKLVERVWGASIADKPLRMKGAAREVPPQIRAALEKVQERSFDPDELEGAMKIARDIGFYEALHVHVMRNSPWTAGLGFPLHGLRQMHKPGKFADSDHRSVIRSPFEYQTPSAPALNEYLVEFPEPKLAASLGLLSSYVVPATDTVLHENAFATYGEPTKTRKVT